jgi:mono/diheme cytochrome c family protein
MFMKIARLAFFAVALCAVVAWFLSAPSPAYDASQAASLEQGGDAERGKLVFAAGGCASCHMTPGQADRTKLGGGERLGSPFGAFIAPNISPHPTDGIGRWRAVDLANAMVSGVSPQGEHYYPAFPYTSYHLATAEDIRDLMAFLRTLEPVAGKAPPHELPFPFTIRRALGLWKLLFFDTSRFAPDSSKSEAWNRGRYLVDGLGHCAECHSGRNILGGIKPSQRYAGGPDPEGKGYVPNLTPDKTGLADWSAKDVAELLKSGFTPAYDSVGGTMASVVKNMSQLSDEDRQAIGEYIKSLPALPATPKTPKATSTAK